MVDNLLNRDEFREGVFNRDNNKCVACVTNTPAQDAHHIVERRLFPDGGYYLDNGASLCGEHHILAEQTILSCEEIRERAGITSVILPPHLYPDVRYDKWGNPFLDNNLQRSPGELFDDISVQRILPQYIKDSFTTLVKYPRTYHLPWSPGLLKDDRQMDSAECFDGKQVVVTVKMDGENTTLYNDYMHARSLSSEIDASRSWVKNLHAKIRWDIPKGWRICGENLFAKHSISYDKLPSFFIMFSIWDDRNVCLSWDITKLWAELLGLEMVPTLYEGIYDENLIKRLFSTSFNDAEMEGYVVRLADGFYYKDFRRSVGKYVRAEHVQTNQHWKRIWTQNKLKGN